MNKYKLTRKLVVILFLVSWVSTIYEINYLYRDVILLFILVYVTIVGLRSNEFHISRSIFLFITISVIGVLFGFPGSLSALLISLRAVVLYPALFWVGRVLYRDGEKINVLAHIYLVLAIVLSVFAAIEFVAPSMFNSILGVLRIQYDSVALLRSGIGVGIGSLFVSRQYLAIYLTLAIAIVLNIDKYTYKSYGTVKWGVALGFFIIIALTLSRTAIITSAIVIMYNFAAEFSVEKALKVFVPFIILFFAVSQLQIVKTAIGSMSDSVNAMDVTMSGRTGLWESYLGETISIKPNFGIVGNSLLGDSLGTADSTYIRIIIAFGIPLSILIFTILIVKIISVLQIKYEKKMFLSFVITFCVASFTFDLSFVFMFCVPLYILMGREYEELCKRK